jgi:DNA-binding transcriptional LysR family regulator
VPNLPDFEGLAVVAKVAEERSFVDAARALKLSVPTVSRAVSRLEERVGGRIFNRTSRSLALTDLGRSIAERAARVLADAEEAENAARDLAHRPRGTVRSPRRCRSACAPSRRYCRRSCACIRRSQSTCT